MSSSGELTSAAPIDPFFTALNTTLKYPLTGTTQVEVKGRMWSYYCHRFELVRPSVTNCILSEITGFRARIYLIFSQNKKSRHARFLSHLSAAPRDKSSKRTTVLVVARREHETDLITIVGPTYIIAAIIIAICY